MRNIIKSIGTGTRKILGIDWPIMAQVERLGPREWIFTRGICNGLPVESRIYTTRREALANLDNYAWDPEAWLADHPEN